MSKNFTFAGRADAISNSGNIIANIIDTKMMLN
jgi:hypothetical protein